MKKNIFIILFSIGSVSAVTAQNFSVDYYSFLSNDFNINPAYCAKGENLSVVVDHRQRAGLSSSNSMLGLRSIMGETQGVGLRLISDNRGAFQASKIDATYANKFTVAKEHTIYFGLSGGMFSNILNTTKINNYVLVDGTDPVLDPSNLKANGFIAGAGAAYEFKDFEFSFSMPQLIDGTQKTNYSSYMFASYKIMVADNISLTPRLYYFNVPVVKNLAGLQVKGEYNQKFWMQMGYLSNSKFNIGLGCRFSNLGLGYHYTTSNNLSKSYTSGIHEVVFMTNLNSSPLASKSRRIRSNLGNNDVSTPKVITK